MWITGTINRIKYLFTLWIGIITELFDLQNKRILSPVHMVRNYEMGRYVTFEVNQPVRIRICQVRGANAACSALFLD